LVGEAKETIGHLIRPTKIHNVMWKGAAFRASRQVQILPRGVSLQVVRSFSRPSAIVFQPENLEAKLRALGKDISKDLSSKGFWSNKEPIMSTDVIALFRKQAVDLRNDGRFEPSWSEAIDEQTGLKTKFYKPGVLACEPDGGDFHIAPDMLYYITVILRVIPSLLNSEISDLDLSDQAFNAKLAVTKPGGYKYPLHIDNVVGERGNDSRKLTCILYLNPKYDPTKDGGELRIFYGDDGKETFDVYPSGGSIVLFWSDEIPHEVLSTATYAHEDDEELDRYALTIWIPTTNISSLHSPKSKFKNLKLVAFPPEIR
jgi:hypothetical protein